MTLPSAVHIGRTASERTWAGKASFWRPGKVGRAVLVFASVFAGFSAHPGARKKFDSSAFVGLRRAVGRRFLVGESRALGKQPPRNPYDVIGAPRGAPKEQVRKLFRKLVVTEHPDVNPDDQEVADRFTEMVSAYNAIMGDELLPDELTALRVKMTKRYREKLDQEFQGQIQMGKADSYLPLILFFFLAGVGVFLTWLQEQPVETIQMFVGSNIPMKAPR